MKLSLALWTVVFFSPSNSLEAEPRPTSVFPLGGQRGTSFEVLVQGEGLDGVQSVWFGCEHLKGAATTFEAAKDGKLEQLVLKVQATADCDLGFHAFRLISASGISGPATIHITSEPSTLESDTPKLLPAQAQAVSYPSMVYGTIQEPGEVDYYAIEVPEGKELLFEVITNSGLLRSGPHHFSKPELMLSGTNGSWFDPRRPTWITCDDASIFSFFPPTTSHYLPRLKHRFEESDGYLLRVGEGSGLGGPHHDYGLRIADVDRWVDSAQPAPEDWTRRVLAHADALDWRERDFRRRLDVDRLAQLRARSGRKDDKKNTDLSTVHEAEPNETATGVLEIPALIVGAIQRPDDVDRFKFNVEPGQALAFEIYLPETLSPYFSPRLTVYDTEGKRVVRNIYRKIAGDGDDWIKSIEPKTLYKFDRGGEYQLEIRDVTSRNGNPQFAYRVLVRNQIPHVGEVHIRADRLNLVPGQSRQWSCVIEREEGFGSNVAVSIDNLPPGIQVLPASAEKPKTGPPLPSAHKERFVAETTEVHLLIHVGKEVSIDKVPSMAQVQVRPILGGALGVPISVKDIPVMVVR